MINYKKIKLSNWNAANIDELYINLLRNKFNFIILDINNITYFLTKEKSIFKIDEKEFLKSRENDIYYKTIINNEKYTINKTDLDIYKEYINKYKDIMQKKIYGDKYIFGSIAVRTDKGFITTIRGKENLNDYTIVSSVDHNTHTINVVNKKATLNAPLLDYLLKNKKVKVIVHINHEYDDNLSYYEYAIPGTTKDSIRDNKSSFNIRHHGIIYLFDREGKLI